MGIWGGTGEPLNTKDWKPELLGAGRGEEACQGGGDVGAEA